MLTSLTSLALSFLSPAIHAASGGSEPVTYARDVAPILQRRCQTCHRAGQVGPFALTSFEDARGRAKMIAAVLGDGTMPPWNAHERFDGVFVNERKLPADEKKVLTDWIAAGMPRGNPSDDPKPVQWPEGWSIGKPDVVLSPDYDTLAKQPLPAAGFAVPREGVVVYQYLTVQTHFPEDRWMRALEVKPGAADVVHHVLVAIQSPKGFLDEKSFLATYVPGDTPSIYPDGYAKRLPKDATLIFQVHYTPNGKERSDRPSIAIVFADGPPSFVVESMAVTNRTFEIPAGAANFEVRATKTFPQELGILSFFPHMHTRGKDFQIVAHYPGGEDQELLFSNYDFNWQESYILADPILMPPGTSLECIGHFDNSAANPNNPDPKSAVRWGDQTFEEMLVGYLDTVIPLE